MLATKGQSPLERIGRHWTETPKEHPPLPPKIGAFAGALSPAAPQLLEELRGLTLGAKIALPEALRRGPSAGVAPTTAVGRSQEFVTASEDVARVRKDHVGLRADRASEQRARVQEITPDWEKIGGCQIADCSNPTRQLNSAQVPGADKALAAPINFDSLEQACIPEKLVRITMQHPLEGFTLGLAVKDLVVLKIMDPRALAYGWAVGDRIVQVNGFPAPHADAFAHELAKAMDSFRAVGRALVFDVLRRAAHGPPPPAPEGCRAGLPPGAYLPEGCLAEATLHEAKQFEEGPAVVRKPTAPAVARKPTAFDMDDAGGHNFFVQDNLGRSTPRMPRPSGGGVEDALFRNLATTPSFALHDTSGALSQPKFSPGMPWNDQKAQPDSAAAGRFGPDGMPLQEGLLKQSLPPESLSMQPTSRPPQVGALYECPATLPILGSNRSALPVSYDDPQTLFA